jgi:acetyl-CoA acyltransferase
LIGVLTEVALGLIDLRSVRRRPATSAAVVAQVVLAWAKDTGADLAKTNVNGGAIAIGHPLGAGGARIMTTMVNALEQRGGRYALQTMCEGGGMANATIIERLD